MGDGYRGTQVVGNGCPWGGLSNGTWLTSVGPRELLVPQLLQPPIIRHVSGKDYHNILQDFGWTRPRMELKVLLLLLRRLLVLAVLNALLNFQVEADGLSDLLRLRLLGQDGGPLQDAGVEFLSFEFIPVE